MKLKVRIHPDDIDELVIKSLEDSVRGVESLCRMGIPYSHEDPKGKRYKKAVKTVLEHWRVPE